MLLDQLTPNWRSTLTTEQIAQIAVISSWDLGGVRTRTKRRMAWSDELTDEAVAEYRKFLVLVALHPGTSFGMVETVDEVWHEHILNTRDYLAMCNAVVNGVIHHEQQPLDSSRALDLRQLREQTICDLEQKFVGPRSSLWSGNAQSAAKCCGGHQPAIGSC